MVRIGEDVSERLDVVPAEFFVHRHIRIPCDVDLPPSNFDIHYSTWPVAPAEDEPEPGPALGTSSGTVKVSIRLPVAVVGAFKKRAVIERKGYHTLVVEALLEHIARTR